MTKSFDDVVSNFKDPRSEWEVFVNGEAYNEVIELLEFRQSLNSPVEFTVRLKGLPEGVEIPEDAEVVVKKSGLTVLRGVAQEFKPDSFNQYQLKGAGYSAELEGDSKEIVEAESGVSNPFKSSSVTEIVDTLIDGATINTASQRVFSTNYSLDNSLSVDDFRANSKQLEDVNRLMGEYGIEWYLSFDGSNNPVFNVTDQIQNDDGSGGSIGTLKTYGSDQTAEKVNQNVNRNKGSFDGVKVRGYGDGDDQITASAGSIGKDSRVLIYTDKTILSDSQAQKRADALNQYKTVVWQEIEVKPNNPNALYSIGDLLTVDSEKAYLSDDYRVVESYYKIWPGENQFESKLNLSNKPQTFLSEFQGEKAKRESQTDYMQGARNIWSDKEAANATNAEPLTIDFEVPQDVIDKAGNNRLDRIEFNYACTSYKQSGDPQSVTADNFDPGVKQVDTSVLTGGVEVEPENIKVHRHAVASASSGGAVEVQVSDGFLFDKSISGSGWNRLASERDGSTVVPVSDTDGDLEHELSFSVSRIENSYIITAVDTTNDVFTVDGDATLDLSSGDVFDVDNSTGNDGEYKVSSISYDSGSDATTISIDTNVSNPSVSENISDSSADGAVFADVVRDLQFVLLGSSDTATASFDYSTTGGGSYEFVSTSGPGFIPSYHWRIEKNSDGSFVNSYTGRQIEHVFTDTGDFDVTLEIYQNAGVGGDLISSDSTNNVFIADGDQTGNLQSGDQVVITDSDGNDGSYTVNTFTTNANSNTEITVFEDVPYSFDSTTDGDVGQIEIFPSSGAALTDSVTQTVTVTSSASVSGLSVEKVDKLSESEQKKVEAISGNVESSKEELADKILESEEIRAQDLYSIIEVENLATFWINTEFGSDETQSTTNSKIEVRNSTDNNGIYTVSSVNFRNNNTETGLTVDEVIPSSTADGDVVIDYTTETNMGASSFDSTTAERGIYIDGQKTFTFEGFLFADSNHSGEVQSILFRDEQADEMNTILFSEPAGFEDISFNKTFDSDAKYSFWNGTATYRWFSDYDRVNQEGKWVNKSTTQGFLPGHSFSLYNFTPQIQSSSQNINVQNFDVEWNAIADNLGDSSSNDSNFDFVNSLELVHIAPSGSEDRRSLYRNYPSATIREGLTATNLSSENIFEEYDITVDAVNSGDSADLTISGDFTSGSQSYSNISEGEWITFNSDLAEDVYFRIERIDDSEFSQVRITISQPFDDSNFLSESYSSLSGGDHEFFIEADVVNDGGSITVQSDTITVTVELNDPPQADFTFSPSNPDTFESVQFDDLSTDPDGDEEIVVWRWNFGDGTTETITSGPNEFSSGDTSHSYSNGGDYTVTLTVEDSSGATDTHTDTVTVGQVDSLSETIIMDSEQGVGSSPSTISSSTLESSGDTVIMTASTGIGTLSSPGSGEEYLDVNYPIPAREMSSEYEMYVATFGSNDKGFDRLRGDFEIINKNHIHDIPRQDDFDDKAADIGAGAENKEVPLQKSNDNRGDVNLDFSTNNEAVTLDTTLNGNDITITVANQDSNGNLTNSEQITANNGTATTTNTYQDSELYIEIDSASDAENFEVRDQSGDDVYALAAITAERFQSDKTSQENEGVSDDQGTQQNIIEGVSSDLLAGTTANNVKVFIDDDPDNDSTNSEQEITGDLYGGATNSGTAKDKELDLSQYVDSPGWYRLKIEPDQASFIKSRVFLDHHKDTT